MALEAVKNEDKRAYEHSLADDDDGDRLALTLRQSRPHAAVLLPRLLVFVLAARGQQAALEAAARRGLFGLVALSLGAPSDKQWRISPRAHHMTATFHNRKARQNLMCAQRRKPIKASTCLISPRKRLRIVGHVHMTMPKACCNLQHKKADGNARIPPGICQVCDFPYQESHANLDAHRIKTPSRTWFYAVQVWDFSLCVWQLQARLPTRQEPSLTYRPAQ